MVYHKVSNDMKERAFWEQDGRSRGLQKLWVCQHKVLGNGRRTMLYMDVWSLSNQSRDVLGYWQVIWLMIYNCYFVKIPPCFLTRSGNGSLSTTTSQSQLWHCIWLYGILPSHINASSELQPNVMTPIAWNGFWIWPQTTKQTSWCFSMNPAKMSV